MAVLFGRIEQLTRDRVKDSECASTLQHGVAGSN